MTDNQTNQIFDLLTKSVNGIQRIENDVAILKTDVGELKTDVTELKADVSELKADVSELKNDVGDLKEGQNRIEKQMRLNDATIDSLAGEQMRLKAAVVNLEKPNI